MRQSKQKHHVVLSLSFLLLFTAVEPISSHAQTYAHYPHTNEIRATEGTWTADIRTDSIQFFFHKKGYTGDGTYGGIFPSKELSAVPEGNDGNFSLKREAGTIEFTGGFNGVNGKGSYRFVADTAYVSRMKELGINVGNPLDQMTFTLVDVTVEFVKMLKSNFRRVTRDDVVPATAVGVNESYIKSMRRAGFNNITLGELVGFRSLNIDENFIGRLRRKGITTTDPGSIMAIKANGTASE